MQKISIREDKGVLPHIVLFIFGFCIGIALVSVVAVHDAWNGGDIRHYNVMIFIYYGVIAGILFIVEVEVIIWAISVKTDAIPDKSDNINKTLQGYFHKNRKNLNK
jgi:hypothetical protein